MTAQAGAFKTVTSNLGQLNRAELVEVAAMVAGLLEALDEDQVADADNGHASAGPTPGSKNGARGHVEWKTINGCGPYPYLRYWSGGKLKSHYLKGFKKGE